MARAKKKIKVSADGTSMGPLIETFGMDALVRALGIKEVVNTIGVDDFLAHLTPKQLRELKVRVAKRD